MMKRNKKKPLFCCSLDNVWALKNATEVEGFSRRAGFQTQHLESESGQKPKKGPKKSVKSDDFGKPEKSERKKRKKRIRLSFGP